jgi:hypothetical protein
VGLPVILKLKLTGSGNFALDNGFGHCDEHTTLIVTDSSHNVVSYVEDAPCGYAQRSPLDSKHKIEFNGSAEASYEIFLLPGEYLISAHYTSFGPYLDRYSETDQRPVDGIWIGS